jgi:hypothetical protein
VDVFWNVRLWAYLRQSRGVISGTAHTDVFLAVPHWISWADTPGPSIEAATIPGNHVGDFVHSLHNRRVPFYVCDIFQAAHKKGILRGVPGPGFASVAERGRMPQHDRALSTYRINAIHSAENGEMAVMKCILNLMNFRGVKRIVDLNNWKSALVLLTGLLVVANVRAVSVAPGESTALGLAKPGDIVLLTNLWPKQAELPVVATKVLPGEDSAQLLLSDAPEYFPSNGISLQEEVKPGVVRLYVYHVPEPAGRKVISAVVENRGNKTMGLKMLRRAFPQPGMDYYRIGKQGLLQYFNSKPEESLSRIRPGERWVVDSRMDTALVTTNDLVHGIFEFEVDQPAMVSVFQRNPEQLSTNVVAKLPKLNCDHCPGGAGRGIFTNSSYAVENATGGVIDTANGAMQLVIADGKKDKWIRGTDSIDGKQDVKNAGNYGVMYHVRLKYRSSNGQGVACLITRKKGYDGGCGWQAAAVRAGAGEFPAGVVAIPANKIIYGEANETVLIQKFPPVPEGKTGEVEFIYSPPGASCLPTPLLLVPYKP